MLERERPQHINTLSMPGIRKFPLTVDQIKAWVDAYRAGHEGEFPSVKSGPILNADGSDTEETWRVVEQALRQGYRGLKNSGFTSLADFLDRTYPDNRHERQTKTDLTLARIKEWVDIYRVGHGGKFPTANSGLVLNADGSDTEETWCNVEQALRQGYRGLKNSGFTSLADFLDRTYPDNRHERQTKTGLTLARIKEWVDIYRAGHGREFPTANSGPVLNADGSDTEETWCNVEQSLRKGYRGLKNSGFTSLADFLDKTYPDKRHSDLTTARIKEWVEIYRARHSGEFPSQHSGLILYEDGLKTGETWVSVNAAFRAGGRGLKDSGFTSLADFLNQTYPVERQSKGDLTTAFIKEWVDIYRAGAAEEFPSQHSGPILNPDGSQTGETWYNIDRALSSGYRGLKNSGFNSLADFLNKTYPDKRNNDLTPAQIKEWVDIYRAGHDREFPTSHAGAILEGEGYETGETWSGINWALRKGLRGLNDSGFTSLPDFLDQTYPKERQTRGDLTPNRIEEWIDIYRVGHKGLFPSQNSGPIVNSDGSATGETWRSIDRALSSGYRGLKDSGFNSLADFLNKTYPAERGRVELVKKEKPDDINSLLNLI